MKNLLLLFLISIIGTSAIYAQNDSILLKNNNIIVGELKKMDRGVLTIETSYSDSDFSIEWAEVIGIRTETHFIVSLIDGGRYSTTLHSEEGNLSKIRINPSSGESFIDISEIVFLRSYNTSFISRISASIDVGYSLTKASNLRQFTARSNISYASDHWSGEITYNALKTTQDDVDDVNRTDANVTFNYFLPFDVFLIVAGYFLKNNEMKLDLRSNIKAGLGYYFVKTNVSYFSANAGLAYNNEQYTDPTIETRNSTEAYLGLELNLFDIGDLNLLTSVIAYPSLTESGRFRTDFKLDVKYDLPFDLYVKAGTTYNYDNQPVEGASDSDYVLMTGFGWEWN